MNRRGFFSFTIGAVIAGPFMRSKPVVIQRHWTLTGEEVFTLQPGLEMATKALKEFARQCDLTSEAFRTIRKDIFASPVFTELFEEDEDDDPRHCIYCGQYPCDCWRDV